MSSHRLFLIIMFTLTAMLTACTEQTATTPPTIIVTATPVQTQEARPTNVALPTADRSDDVDDVDGNDEDPLAVDFGELITYTHPSGVFSIDIPANWTLRDDSQPDELFLTWIEPNRKGGVIIDLFEDDNAYENEELISILDAFLSNNFSNQIDFQSDEPSVQNDDSILIAWAYTATSDSVDEFTQLGNSFVEQRGNKISILTTLVPDEGFDVSVEVTNIIINSYRINPEVPLISAN